MKKLVIILDQKEPTTNHICNADGCPFYGDNKICQTLWGTPPSGRSKLASLCNYYEVQNLTIAEVDESVRISDIK